MPPPDPPIYPPQPYQPGFTVLDERRRLWFAAFGESMMGGGPVGIPDDIAKLDVLSIPGIYPWAKDPAATFIVVAIYGCGAGGAGGGRGASSILGGGGGAGGQGHYNCFDAAFLGATATIVIGAGGLGGLGRATDGPGLIGGFGGDTSFTDSNGLVMMTPSQNPGTATAGGGPLAGAAWNLGPATAGAPSIAGVGKGGTPQSAIGGSGGGSITAALAAGAGGDLARQVGFCSLAAAILGGLGSTTGNGAPGSAPAASTAMLIFPGYQAGNAGGGGGGASTFAGGNGGAGGNGASPAGGGGGGGACISGTSGKGGDGAPGFVVVYQFR